jgi:hypothetical protein
MRKVCYRVLGTVEERVRLADGSLPCVGNPSQFESIPSAAWFVLVSKCIRSKRPLVIDTDTAPLYSNYNRESFDVKEQAAMLMSAGNRMI